MTNTTIGAMSGSAATKPFAAARARFDEGVPLRRVQRLFNMTEGELRDMAPEEFDDTPAPKPGGLGGY